MSGQGRYSPLFDPLLLNSSAVDLGGPNFADKLKKMNWLSILVNIIIPVSVLLFAAFHLKAKYDKKRSLYEEYNLF